MELYIIRHAQSSNNALTDQRQRVADPPLTDLGHQQAAAVARHLREGVNFDLISDRANAEDTHLLERHGFNLMHLYCSPMHRALQTAQPIANATGLMPRVWKDIHEHGGIYLDHHDERGTVGYPGLSRAEIDAQFPGYQMDDEVTEAGWWTGGMEEIATAYGRAVRVADRLHAMAEEFAGERVALVSHGTFIDALIKALFSQLPTRNLWYVHYNTAITRIDFHPERMLLVRYINRVEHLSPELVT